MGLILCLLLVWGVAADDGGRHGNPIPALPPDQPATGPGGSDYRYARMRVSRFGEGAETYWLFEPRGVDKAEPRPVVLFLHGMNAPHYGVYRQWIAHLVRHGNLVVYPRYQQGSITNPHTFTDTAAQAMRQSIGRMDGERHAAADKERFAIVGHSLGGTIGLNLAARPEHFGLPVPKAIMPVQPGDVEAPQGIGVFFPRVAQDYSTIRRGTLMLVIASTNDAVVGNRFAKRVWRETTAIAEQDKDLLLMSNDRHGDLLLSSDHFMPLAFEGRSGRHDANAYDFALWRWFDALTDAAFREGRHRAFALGDAEAQRMIGKWSDGKPAGVIEVYQPADESGVEP